MYRIEIYSIKDIKKPKLLEEILIDVDTRSDAIEQAHTYSLKKYPQEKIFTSISEKINDCF